MSERANGKQLQPSLLDRLTDHQPLRRNESRDDRSMSLEKLRASVLRDVRWLLNTARLEQMQALDDYPLVRESVLNFGVPDYSGQILSPADVPRLQRDVREALLRFEPRILPHTLKVLAGVAADAMSHRAVTFEIQGSLWAQPVPIHLFMKTEIDLETGHVNVFES